MATENKPTPDHQPPTPDPQPNQPQPEPKPITDAEKQAAIECFRRLRDKHQPT
ncbi:hypothetical protein [Herpetosiphon geysericola]|uniref:hypothetical protein n=1 Tax=Herpetosiphon geysericola TaxID=70996 RepID=UPI001364B04E|nr:hypothetical protein [Herpetosiphon geysericola]